MPSRRLRHAVLLSIAIGYIPALARADGIAFRAADDSQARPAEENEQIAAIECADGRETMTLAVGLRLDNHEHAVWIVPIPAGTRAPKVDIVDRFPQFHGEDPRVRARNNAWKFGLALRSMTVVTLLFEVIELIPTLSAERSLEILAEVEKYGLRTEIVDCRSLDQLAQHLRDNGVDLAPARLQSLARYTDGNWRFVITWIQSRDTLRQEFPEVTRGDLGTRVPCIRVEFDSPEPYFPLRPSAGLAGESIAIRVYVHGYYTPVTAKALRLRCRHFLEDGRGYTLVSGYVSPSTLVEDLRLSPHQPRGMFTASAVNLLVLNPVGWILILVGFSALAGAAAGKLAFSDVRRGAYLGLFHVGSLAAIILRLRHEQFATPPNADPILYQRVIRRDFAKYFTLIFVALTILLQAGLYYMLPEHSE